MKDNISTTWSGKELLNGTGRDSALAASNAFMLEERGGNGDFTGVASWVGKSIADYVSGESKSEAVKQLPRVILDGDNSSLSRSGEPKTPGNSQTNGFAI